MRSLFHKSFPLIAALALSGLVCQSAGAAVVTNNNLVTTNLGTVANPGAAFNATPSTSSVAFTPDASRLFAVSASVVSTSTGITDNSFGLDSLSTVPNSTNSNFLARTVRALNGAYGPTNSTYVLGANAAPPTLYYNLRLGDTADNRILNWSFQASNLTLYQPGNADSGLITGFAANQVPNASFEDSSISFTNGGLFVADPGKQGSQVWSTGTTTLDRFIALPVRVGVTYAFSFWSFRSVGGDTEVEYGLTTPFTRGAEPGNTLGGGAAGQWVENTGTFTPTGAQTNFYISGFANVGSVRFDSLFLAQVPEPASAIALVGITGLMTLKRKRQVRAAVL
jgi:hypothetical protein